MAFGARALMGVPASSRQSALVSYADYRSELPFCQRQQPARAAVSISPTGKKPEGPVACETAISIFVRGALNERLSAFRPRSLSQSGVDRVFCLSHSVEQTGR